jgi:hypothetical protein
LKKVNETKLIFLSDELYKFKFYIKTVSVRWIIFLNIENAFIPILITKKSDKNYGNNLILNKDIQNILETKFQKMTKDLENNNFDTYE